MKDTIPEMLEAMTKKCLRCGYTWQSIKLYPKCCPVCKSRFWHVKKNDNQVKGGEN